jgi:hypothetical protein
MTRTMVMMMMVMIRMMMMMSHPPDQVEAMTVRPPVTVSERPHTSTVTFNRASVAR